MHGRFITFRVSLVDAEIHTYERGHTSVRVEIHARNGKSLELEFTGLEGLLDYPGRDISALVWFATSDFLDAVTQRVFPDGPPEELPYRSYQFLDGDDEVCLEIIAAHCEERLDPSDIAVDT